MLQGWTSPFVMTMRRFRSMPVSSAMGPSGSAGEDQLIGFGVGPVMTTFVDDLFVLAGCCACANNPANTIAAFSILRGHVRDFMTPDSTATGCALNQWMRSAQADPEPDTILGQFHSEHSSRDPNCSSGDQRASVALLVWGRRHVTLSRIRGRRRKRRHRLLAVQSKREQAIVRAASSQDGQILLAIQHV